MNFIATHILRAAILALGMSIVALCIFVLPAMWTAVPQEYPDHTYVFYSIIGALYITTLPFYVALYQALRLLRLIDTRRAFTGATVKALHRIAISAALISFIYLTTMPFFYQWADGDDAPGLLVINLFLILAPLTIAIFAAVLRRLFSEAITFKAENDLTV